MILAVVNIGLGVLNAVIASLPYNTMRGANWFVSGFCFAVGITLLLKCLGA